ncbi:peptidase family M41-domain-containing protein [Acrodontium crateriforme]|uniref:Peptidase family M41-domain-containing protein n=1 Tax=Acrodontium crateriforme TaxID=150365 RepID=A0AAQ3M2T2_9PEZI|nr:peptidase family M41-domain-containing protein [Acrodontium crateriforme]
MAFQAPTSVSQMAAAASEMWPSMAAVIKAPRRTLLVGRRRQPEHGQQQDQRVNTLEVETLARSESVQMPEFLGSVATKSLRRNIGPSATFQSTPTISNMLSGVPKGMLRYASPVARSFHSSSQASRVASSVARFGPLTFRAPAKTSFVGFSQQRSLFGSTWGQQTNRNLLAHLEQTANNNPGSATSQHAFYQALLRANMPEIIAERYQTNRYATNSACETVYNRALERIGMAETGSIGAVGGRNAGGQNQQLSSEQLQAIGQAVSAKTRGGSISISKTSAGSKAEPMYVVVDETWSALLFKWVKFGLVFAFCAYAFLAILTMVIDNLGMVRKIGGAQNSEVKPEVQSARFSDVQGCDEAKEELQELVDFLKNPEKFSTLGGKLPKGILLVGPPGTGKTLLARAVAGEAGVPFFYMSGSEFDEVYVGVGAKRVRDLFTAARAKSPSIIFIDELDAIGSKRHERDAAYAKQTLNQLLTELDGFEQDSGVIILGATNFPQSLDKALTRPGRFDRNVSVPLPDVRGRIAILKHHLRNIRIDSDVDPAIIARGCPGFSGAELENVVNQAAIRASKNKALKVSLDDLSWAKDKILMGAERRSAVIQQKDKVMTAYHEGGHALVAMLTEASMPLYKATIMPRGHALGITQMLPEMDKVSETKKEMMAQIDVAMGGKVAEELVYGADNVTTGASSDITNATRLAYTMVTQAGMSDVLGNIDLSSDYARLSSETKQQIEHEVRRLVEEGRDRALKLLTKNRAGLDRLARALVEYETLDKEEMEKVVRGEKLTDKIKVDPDAPMKVPEGGVPSLPGPSTPPGVFPPTLGGDNPAPAGPAGGEGGNGRPFPTA